MQYQVCVALLLWSTLPAGVVAQDPYSPSQIVFSISQIVSQYLQATQLPDLAAALVSAASAANDTTPFTQVLQSVVLGPPPSYITAIPLAYRTQIASIESALSALQDSVVSSAEVAASSSAGFTANSTSVASPSRRFSNTTSSKITPGTSSLLSSSVQVSVTSSFEIPGESYTTTSPLSILPSSLSGASSTTLSPSSGTTSTSASATSYAVFTGAASYHDHAVAGILGLLGLAIAL